MQPLFSSRQYPTRMKREPAPRSDGRRHLIERNTKMNRSAVRTALAVALLAALATPVLATTQSTLTLSDFSFTLKDLNASDDVAPLVSWTSTPTYSVLLYTSTQAGWLQNGNLYYPNWVSGDPVNDYGGQPINATYGTASALSLGSGSGGPGTISVSSFAAAGKDVFAYADFSDYFWLSPGTQVTFKYVATGAFNGSSGEGLWAQPPGTSAQSHSASNYSASLTVIGSISSSIGGSGTNDWVYNPAAYDGGIDRQVIQLTVRNNTASAQMYQFYASAGVDASEAFSPTAVPEPSSHALMALGLLALAGAVARRRRKG